MTNIKVALFLFIIAGCGSHDIYNKRHHINTDSIISPSVSIRDTAVKTTVLSEHADSIIAPIKDSLPNMIKVGNITADSVINFAKTLLGTPYRYGSTDPKVGFDCSGFFTYVFSHFNIKVPRSSKEFEFSGINVPLKDGRKGDLILFTGTDSTERFIGHMGLILENNGGAINFIHSSSGKAYGVTISPLDKYYMGRFLKIIRIFTK